MSSSELILEIIKPGMFTTLQDLGRPGQQHKGIPFGGALDQHSAKLVNKLLNNPLDTPVMEITLIGPEIKFQGKGLIGISGAHLQPTLNGSMLANNEVTEVSDGDVLQFGKAVSGCRAYLGVAGEWQVQKWMNSVSPLSVYPQFTPDSWCKKGQQLQVISKEAIQDNEPLVHTSPGKQEVRVFKGPEFYDFKRQDQQQLFSSHRLSNDSNRMGYRLETTITPISKELISSGVFPGVIQVTHEGQLIVLMRDGQTTGGYPRIGVVHTDDLDILAQLKPGDSIHFSEALG